MTLIQRQYVAAGVDLDVFALVVPIQNASEVLPGGFLGFQKGLSAVPLQGLPDLAQHAHVLAFWGFREEGEELALAGILYILLHLVHLQKHGQQCGGDV